MIPLQSFTKRHPTETSQLGTRELINVNAEQPNQYAWWPGLNKDLETMVNSCSTCCKTQSQQAEPLMPSPLPTPPWQKVGVDLFKYKKSSYIIIIDDFSCFIEIAKLTNTSSTAVITHMKSIFARHGIPYCVMSDNGPQFSLLKNMDSPITRTVRGIHKQTAKWKEGLERRKLGRSIFSIA